MTHSQVIGGSLADTASVQNALFQDGPVDVIISCIASRSGTPDDSWRVDHAANVHLLDAAMASEKPPEQFIMLSAFCVRKPELVVS